MHMDIFGSKLLTYLPIYFKNLLLTFLFVCICSGFRARDRDKSKQHLMVYSTIQGLHPTHPQSVGKETIPFESALKALKPRLYILITA